MEFFATAARGTERLLAQELDELGFAGVQAGGGGVVFSGERVDGWRACLQSRIAQRIQLPLSRFPAESADALYAGAKAVDWSCWLNLTKTLAVSAYVRDSTCTHSGFAALKVKDAIVDALRIEFGDRPMVHRDDPDVQVFLHLVRDQASLYLDLSGDALFKRGYREVTGEAPLKETLAAAMLRLSGWDRRQPLLDPMCGSGTIAIEAAMWAANLAPGLFRKRFGFERWVDFTRADAEQLQELRGQLRRDVHGQTPRITASDADAAVIECAKANARTAGVRIAFRQAQIEELRAVSPPPLVVTNPPYGIRLGGAGQDEFQKMLGAVLSRLHGSRVCVLTGNEDLPRRIPLHPAAAFPLYNGDIECRFLIYDVP